MCISEPDVIKQHGKVRKAVMAGHDKCTGL